MIKHLRLLFGFRSTLHLYFAENRPGKLLLLLEMLSETRLLEAGRSQNPFSAQAVMSDAAEALVMALAFKILSSLVAARSDRHCMNLSLITLVNGFLVDFVRMKTPLLLPSGFSKDVVFASAAMLTSVG